jgi:hypothetical protein
MMAIAEAKFMPKPLIAWGQLTAWGPRTRHERVVLFSRDDLNAVVLISAFSAATTAAGAHDEIIFTVKSDGH